MPGPLSIILLVLVAALVVFLLGQQLFWSRLDLHRPWLLPVILAVVGILLMSLRPFPTAPLDLIASGILFVVAFLTGIAMAAITQFRAAVSPPPSRKIDTQVGQLDERTGWGGVAMLTILVVARVALSIVLKNDGARYLSTSGILLLLFAANRVAYVIAIRPRVRQATVRLGH
ncbi:hypothetical protein [Nakamurella leprariae]|uniref:DUF1453 family protein n=1 Tax=Nakamurella leprariae TaxID=2803911 RepID=A0A938YGQ6_9ACTN|nr:hypothetical protein [Nakamurella leprariae]MBM9469288.1 hypothetical protein [Nakamurella leprariae]